MPGFIDYMRLALVEALNSLYGPEQKSVSSGAILSPRTLGRRKPTFPTEGISTEKAIREGHNINEWVKVCVDRIARPTSSVPWRVSKFVSVKARREIVSELKGVPEEEKSLFLKSVSSDYLEPQPLHPLEQLIENPNPFFDRQLTIETLMQHILLGGNGILTKVRNSNKVPVQLWIIPPDNINPVPHRKKFISHYLLRVKGEDDERIRNEDVMHFKLPDPGDLWWGQSVLTAGARTIDTDVEAVHWQKMSFENRAVPDGALILNEEIDPDDFEIMREQLESQYAGADRARRIMLLGNAAKYYQMSLSPVEMDFITSRKMNRESICALFGVNPAVAGITENINYSTLKEANRDHWVSLIIPGLERLQSVFNRSLAREFGKEIFIWYDTTNVDALQENFHEKTRSSVLLTRQGVPFQAVNRRLRMGFKEEELPGLDIGFMPASSRSVQEILNNENEPNVGEGTQDPNADPSGGEPDVPPPGDNPNAEPEGDVEKAWIKEFREALRQDANGNGKKVLEHPLHLE